MAWSAILISLKTGHLKSVKCGQIGSTLTRGDTYLRTLLIHGARAVMRHLERRDDAKARWVVSLKERRGFNKAIVALAAKNARILWAMMARGEPYWGGNIPRDSAAAVMA